MYKAKNNAITTLATWINNSQTSATLTNLWLFPINAECPFIWRFKKITTDINWVETLIRQEFVNITAVSWNTITMTRAYESCPLSSWSTTIQQVAQSFDSWDIFEMVFSAWMYNYLDSAITWDFYKYQIIPTVNSWNLTVALKNYAWNDPSASSPVKIQIWDTVRTITSALSVTMSAWFNLFNAWSSELATKEIDYFCYLFYSTVSDVVWIWMCRIPYATTQADVDVATTTNEKFCNRSITANTTDKYVNIWRFSAILSSWAWYTWSLWTWPTINYYIDKTRWLDFVLNSTWTWTVPSYLNYTYKYRLISDECEVKCFGWNTVSWWSNTQVLINAPFSSNWQYTWFGNIANWTVSNPTFTHIWYGSASIIQSNCNSVTAWVMAIWINYKI